METREIPRDEWRSFFDIFSRQHEGWLAKLEVFGQELDVQHEPRELPLKGISLTPTVDKSTAIAIDLGKSAEDHVKHAIIEPAHVWLLRTPEGANAALKIESADKTKTVLRFRSAVLPEFVDGIVDEII
ncbi:MAG TPA: DUF5335 family protein [Pyrinomonadaceae bacterium]|jgi:hypothetical protein|nr:DUF5335 family protein [Pyrinomonadaceae bacterium]